MNKAKLLACGLPGSFVRLALGAIILCSAADQAFAGRSFNVKPQPAWVHTTQLPAIAVDGAGESGSASLLFEQQSRVGSGGTERFHRRVEKVVTSAGLDDVSELQFDFEPSYEQLTIHHIRIIRGDRVIDALKPGEIKVIQQENDLYQRIYNGMLSALIFLHDVRVGDLIDYAYTIKGDNPVLGGRYADFVYLKTARTITKLSWRLIWPAGRQLHMRARNTESEPRISQLAGETEYLWEGENVPAVEDEVRYLGIEMGPNSHLPTQPSVVFERRFGDCKDKSLLLATILNSLGIEAYPALVNTQTSHTLDDWQPSPFAFNHVIVQVKLGGKSYWFDPTATQQRGSLDKRYNPDYARALVVKDGSRELEEIKKTDHRNITTEIKEFYTIQNYEMPAQLEVVTTYRGSDADDMRNQFAQQSVSELAKSYLDYYAQTDPAIQADGDPQITDDEEANTIVTRERYKIPNFWTKGSRVFGTDRINMEVTRTGISRRSQPLAVRFPVSIAHLIEIRMPERVSLSKDSESISDEAVSFRFNTSQSGKTVKLEYYYTALRDHVPPDRVAKHLEALAKIQAVTGYEISTGDMRPDWARLLPVFGFALAIVPVVIAGIVIGVIRVRANRRRNSLPAYFRLPPGAGPETAIPVFSDYDFGHHLIAFRCRCGAPYYRPGAPLHQEGLTYDGRRLAVVRLSCQYCANYQDVYFAYRQAEPGYPPAQEQQKRYAAPDNDQLPQP